MSKKRNINEIVALGKEVKDLYEQSLKVSCHTSNILPKNHKLSIEAIKIRKQIQDLKAELDIEFMKETTQNLVDAGDCFYGQDEPEIINKDMLN